MPPVIEQLKADICATRVSRSHLIKFEYDRKLSFIEADETDEKPYDVSQGYSWDPRVHLVSKETRRTLSQYMLAMFTYMYNSDWAGFKQFAKYVKTRHRDNLECVTLVDLLKIEFLSKHKCNSRKALRLYPKIEANMKKSDMSQDLRVRYLASKSSTLEFLGEVEEAWSLRRQAAQQSVLLHPNSPIANNLHTYAVHLVTPKRTSDGQVVLPDDATFATAEKYYRWGCQQRYKLAMDVCQESKIPETAARMFFLIVFIRYVFLVLRSCLGSGFNLFDILDCPSDNLVEAENCLEYIKQYLDILTLSAKIEFKLVQCDYYLRMAGREELVVIDSWNWYLKAKTCAAEALTIMEQDKNAKMGRAYDLYAKWRLEYIVSKMDTLNFVLSENYTPSSLSQTTNIVQETIPAMDSVLMANIQVSGIHKQSIISETDQDKPSGFITDTVSDNRLDLNNSSQTYAKVPFICRNINFTQNTVQRVRTGRTFPKEVCCLTNSTTVCPMRLSLSEDDAVLTCVKN